MPKDRKTKDEHLWERSELYLLMKLLIEKDITAAVLTLVTLSCLFGVILGYLLGGYLTAGKLEATERRIQISLDDTINEVNGKKAEMDAAKQELLGEDFQRVLGEFRKETATTLESSLEARGAELRKKVLADLSREAARVSNSALPSGIQMFYGYGRQVEQWLSENHDSIEVYQLTAGTWDSRSVVYVFYRAIDG